MLVGQENLECFSEFVWTCLVAVFEFCVDDDGLGVLVWTGAPVEVDASAAFGAASRTGFEFPDADALEFFAVAAAVAVGVQVGQHFDDGVDACLLVALGEFEEVFDDSWVGCVELVWEACEEEVHGFD